MRLLPLDVAPPLGNHVDDSEERVRPVQGRTRPTNDFDPLDEVDIDWGFRPDRCLIVDRIV